MDTVLDQQYMEFGGRQKPNKPKTLFIYLQRNNVAVGQNGWNNEGPFAVCYFDILGVDRSGVVVHFNTNPHWLFGTHRLYLEQEINKYKKD